MLSTGIIIFVSIVLFSIHFLGKLFIHLGFKKGYGDKIWIYGSNITYLTNSIFPIYWVWVLVEFFLWLYKHLM